ncbi:unnamed protein product [Clonostachys solani]|uniref:Uncharacterized protein n=1 Tax=Clonostachys solani TaxID=160281 RepID=A0A9N9YZ40_9HYPO|nr:unnamed protein product [Clonostachys solani]
MAEPAKPMAEPTYSQFACIGGGFSGIGLGATLQRWYGITDVRIFERDEFYGGTWWANSYPGAACDIPSALYSLSYEPNADWSVLCPPRDELLQYIIRVVKKYRLEDRISLNSRVDRCEWREESRRWRITVHNLKTGETSLHECQFLFTCAGGLVTPQELDIPGAESFKGPVFHTARWRKDVDLTDKKVIVIGNGATGNQLVPAILPKTKHLTHLVRSQHWILRPLQSGLDPILRLSLKYIPGVMILQRLLVFSIAEEGFRGFCMTRDGQRARNHQRKEAITYLKETAPEKYHDVLVPNYEPNCKRRVFDAGYLKCLNEDNITLTTEKPIEVVPEGIRTEKGLIEADVIVLANGFKTGDPFSNIEIVGSHGKTIQEHWASMGGPGAYNCTSINGFPNFFMILGPNTLTGHSSALLASENAINYSLRLIKPILDGEATTVDVRREAEARYNRKIQAALQDTVWLSGGCSNWYTGIFDGKKYNAVSYPWWQPHYWYSCLFPRWSDFEYTGIGKPRRRHSASRGAKIIAAALVIAGLAYQVKQGKTPTSLRELVALCWANLLVSRDVILAHVPALKG